MNYDTGNFMATDATGGVVVTDIANGGNVGMPERSKADSMLFDFRLFAQHIEFLGQKIAAGIPANERVSFRCPEYRVVRLVMGAAQDIEQGDCFRPERGGLRNAGFEPCAVDTHNTANRSDFLPEQVRAILPIHSGIQSEIHAGAQPAVTERVIEQFAEMIVAEFPLAVFALAGSPGGAMLRLVGDFKLAPVQRQRSKQGVVHSPLEHRADGADVSGNGWRAVILPVIADGAKVRRPEIGDERIFATLGNEHCNTSLIFLPRVIAELARAKSSFAVVVVGAGQIADGDNVTGELFDFRLASLDEYFQFLHRLSPGAAAFAEINNAAVDAFDVAFERSIQGQMVGKSARHRSVELYFLLYALSSLRVRGVGYTMDLPMKNIKSRLPGTIRQHPVYKNYSGKIDTSGESVKPRDIVADEAAETVAGAGKVIFNCTSKSCTKPPCEYCGNSVKSHLSKTFCSPKCSAFALFYRALRDDPEARYPAVQHAAQLLLASGRRCGFIKPARRCAICKSGGKIHGHHPDYRQPHLITWLCPGCHRGAHMGSVTIAAQKIAELATFQCEPPIPKNGFENVTHPWIDNELSSFRPPHVEPSCGRKSWHELAGSGGEA